jgi:pimeloyl-ACP methyl ester carboxylesterase
VVLVCRLLPLELLVPVIARTPLLDLGLRSAYSDPQAVDPELRRLIARPALRPRAARALRAMSIGMALRPRAATAAPLLRRMRQPLLVLWGAQDRLVPPRISRQLQHHKPDLDLRLLPGLGHCPHDEQPHLFNAQVLHWLQGAHRKAPAPQAPADA